MGMIETAVNPVNADVIETVLREELAYGNASSATVIPILQHLLASDGNSLFSEEIVARVRGMVANVAEQLVETLRIAAGEDEGHAGAIDANDLVQGFVENPAFLAHVHALSIEWQLTERLQSRIDLDPVLSPLIQEYVASTNANVAALTMKLLAAQARFGQAQRRMKLPLSELPGDLLNSVLLVFRSVAHEHDIPESAATKAEAIVRTSYNEAATRLGLIEQLIVAMGAKAVSALSVSNAGVALFLSTLAVGSGQDRDAAVLSTGEAQAAQLALALRAAGLKPDGIRDQFLSLHPDLTLPDGFELINADRAASILAAGGHSAGG